VVDHANDCQWLDKAQRGVGPTLHQRQSLSYGINPAEQRSRERVVDDSPAARAAIAPRELATVLQRDPNGGEI
jgi:hypothetical protein